MREKPPLVYAVVLTHNHIDYTRRALASLQRMTYPAYRLLVVDNFSSDGTVEVVRKEFPAVEILVQASNLGFAAGMNAGLRLALARGAESILIANNDVEMDPELLFVLQSAMERDAGIGAVAPLILSMSQPGRIWSSGFRRDPYLLEMRGGKRDRPSSEAPRQTTEVDYLPGCVLLLRSQMLQRAGLFDERFFFYYEDLDLCLRAQQCGYMLLVVPEARAWHLGAATAGQASPFQTYHRARGSVMFVRKHAKGLRSPLAMAFRLGSFVAASARALLAGRGDLLNPLWRGAYDGWLGK